MHAGRHYPYHPSYWATEAWYWPGFVPFKLRGELNCAPFGFWTQIPLNWTGVSDPGVTSADCKTITYEFAIDPPGAYPQLLVTLEKVILAGQFKARWKVDLNDALGTLDTCWAWQSYPQLAVYVNGLTDAEPPLPPSAGNTICLEFRPATYAEGGSPWLLY